MPPEWEGHGDLRLRPQTGGDRDFLYRLYSSTRADEMALVDWSEEQKRAFVQMQFEAQAKHYTEYFPAASFDIIELDGESIGRLYVEMLDDELRIIDIALLPDFRRRGIGAHYMHSLMRQAVDVGACVAIHVEKNNPAMGLYERLGFERVEDKGVYWFMRWRTGPDQENTAS